MSSILDVQRASLLCVADRGNEGVDPAEPLGTGLLSLILPRTIAVLRIANVYGLDSLASVSTAQAKHW